MKTMKRNAAAQRRLWEQNPRVLQPAIYYVQGPEFSHQSDQESTGISPGSWKTRPAEPEDVIPGSSFPCWVGTALEDGSKVASWARNESECPDLATVDCAEAVTERMRQGEFQDLENIGIKDPPDVDEDVPERNRGTIQKNQVIE